MKPLTLLLLAATTLLSTSALPPQPRQKALSPALSFSSSDSSSSSSSHKPSVLFKLSSLLPTKQAPFKCHHDPDTPLLPDLTTYITTLLRSYRESIFSSSHNSGNSDQSRILFKSCYAGYAADDLKPSIYFGNLARKQSVVVEKLLRNQVVGRFPKTEVLRTGNVIAVVMKDGEGLGLRRRNTV